MGRSASRASISPCRAARGGLDEALALAGVRLLVGGVLGGGEPGLELAQAGQVLLAGLAGRGDGPFEALGLAACRAGERAVLPQLLGDRGEGRVGLVELGQGDAGLLERVVALGLQT